MPQFHGVRACGSRLHSANLPCAAQSTAAPVPVWLPVPREEPALSHPSVALGLLILGRAERSVLAFAQGQHRGGRDPSSTTGSRYGCLHPLCPQDRD